MNSLADQAVSWQDHQLVLLDQRKLPGEIQFIKYSLASDVATAIENMIVRGAPAIGVTAAYGVVLAARASFAKSPAHWKELVEYDLDALRQARPTAVNLNWAISRMRTAIDTITTADPEDLLLQVAQAIHREDIQANKTLADYGARLIESDSSVITHCNAGALATGGYGTALGVIRSAFAQNKIKNIYADETRPWFQGTRLTAWELQQYNIPVTLICDSAAATVMRQKKITWVIVGADRIVSNGDIANKIGTYSLAVMAKQHGVKFMVAAPTSSIDMQLSDGNEIAIEERSYSEVVGDQDHCFGPKNIQVWNPVFDITPASLITAIVTEKGVVEHPNQAKIKVLMNT